jgi:hypothetical protein
MIGHGDNADTPKDLTRRRPTLAVWLFVIIVGPLIGVRPFRWTASCCGFDQALGVLILEVDGAAVAER